jgi:chitinase
MYKSLLVLAAIALYCIACQKEIKDTPNEFLVVGYYSGSTEMLDSFDVSPLTHIIFSFGHLKGNRLNIDSKQDSATIQKMVAMKDAHPKLKVLLSLGGWTGCEPCSDVFNTSTGRTEFAESLKELTAYFNTDGIDLDWEYPVIPGPPGHPYRPEDKENFTLLVKEIRAVNGDDFDISFAAGGFPRFINESIDWKEVIRYTDFINIMTYDLVHGYSKVSGHHTPLYSTPQQVESTDTAVQMLLTAGVPPEQIVIGAAFYGRFFKIDTGSVTDLYAPCHFSHGFSYRHNADSLSNGFSMHWDSIAQAPYAINPERQMLATYDDPRSIALKTRYAKDNNLGGIMFWQLADDAYQDGLLQIIDSTCNASIQ